MKTWLMRMTALSLCVLAPLVYAQQQESMPSPVLRAAYVNFPPLTYTDVNGQPAGYYISLTEQAAFQAGYRLKWKELPIGRIFLQLKLGELDLWPGVGDMSRLQPLAVETTASIGDLTLAAFGFRDMPEKCKFTDLAGNRLILMAGYTYFGALDFLMDDGRTKVGYAPHHRAGLGMLTRGRGDYFLDYVEPLSVVLADSPVKDLKWCELRKSRLALLVSRKTLNHRAIIDQLNAVIEDNRLLINP